MSKLIFIQTDQAGAEAMIVAYCCPKESNFRALFDLKIKPHVFVAMMLFKEQFEAELGFSLEAHTKCGVRLLQEQHQWREVERCIKDSDNWPASRRYYFIGKKMCHSGNYDIGGSEYALNVLKETEGKIVIPLQESERQVRAYKTIIFPEISLYHNMTVSEARKNKGVLYNLFGFPIEFTGNLDERETHKKLYAARPQSTVGLITIMAHTEIQELLDDGTYEGFAIMQNNHDSLLFQTTEENAENVIALSQKHMNRKLTSPSGEIFYMRSESSRGYNWKELH